MLAASSHLSPLPQRVSCLLVNYFSAAQMQLALQSVLSQNLQNERLKITFDVVVVDNSVDAQEAQNLRDWLAAWKAANPDSPAVELLINTHNTGFGQANNLAFAHSKGDWVMLLNPDTRMQANCLLELLQALLKDPALGACGPAQYWDDNKTWHLPPAWLPTGIGTWTHTKAHHQQRDAMRLSNAYRNLSLQSWSGTKPVKQRAISGGAMLLRRSAIEAPLFDPAFFMYFEDSDLSLRLQRKGWQLALVPQALLVHDWAHSAGKVAMMEASRKLYFDKHFEGKGQWQRRLQSLETHALSNPLNASAMHLRGEPLKLQIPEAWSAAWLLEGSPSPLMTPSMGVMGSGHEVQVSVDLLRKMSFKTAGSHQWQDVYVRLGPARKTREPLQTFKLDLN